jgi:tRNA (pseudouridine54-N1)-methyltransferase
MRHGMQYKRGMRRFIVVGQTATASDDFLLDDLASSGGRIDVLLRCLRAAALVSHGIRHDVVAYLVLGGGPRAPRALRLRGVDAKFVRPDERSLAGVVRKALARSIDAGVDGFVELKHGMAVASRGLDDVIADIGAATPYILEEGAPDLRDEARLGIGDAAFFLGDHLGFDAKTRARLAGIDARPVGVGPVSLHTEDVIAIVSNEIDRREARLPSAQTR